MGCRRYLTVQRHTGSNEIRSVQPAGGAAGQAGHPAGQAGHPAGQAGHPAGQAAR
jgi:sarcosine oxidase delta subunit